MNACESVFVVAAGRRARWPMVVAALIGLAGAGIPARAQVPERLPVAHVLVVGEGKVSVVPDLAQIRGGVTTNAKTVKEAVETNSKTMAAIITTLTESGIVQKDIQTAQFSLQPVYAPQDPHAESKLSGYRVSNQVTAKIRHIDKLGDALERLTAAGANDVWNVEFLVSDPSKALDEAREAAIADARRKAEVYARAAGVTLGRVVSIEEGGASPGPMVLRSRALAAGMAQPVPIETGEDTLHAMVTVGFDLAK